MNLRLYGVIKHHNNHDNDHHGELYSKQFRCFSKFWIYWNHRFSTLNPTRSDENNQKKTLFFKKVIFLDTFGDLRGTGNVSSPISGTFQVLGKTRISEFLLTRRASEWGGPLFFFHMKTAAPNNPDSKNSSPWKSLKILPRGYSKIPRDIQNP